MEEKQNKTLKQIDLSTVIMTGDEITNNFINVNGDKITGKINFGDNLVRGDNSIGIGEQVTYGSQGGELTVEQMNSMSNTIVDGMVYQVSNDGRIFDSEFDFGGFDVQPNTLIKFKNYMFVPVNESLSFSETHTVSEINEMQSAIEDGVVYRVSDSGRILNYLYVVSGMSLIHGESGWELRPQQSIVNGKSSLGINGGVALGRQSTAIGGGIAYGWRTFIANGGVGSIAIGDYSQCLGSGITYGYHSFINGVGCQTGSPDNAGLGGDPGSSAHAEGRGTIAYGRFSHSEGYKTEANGLASHSEGSNTKANGDYSHADGTLSVANGNNSYVWNGDKNNEYVSSVNGSFNVNPVNGTDGFRIGDKTLTQIVKPLMGVEFDLNKVDMKDMIVAIAEALGATVTNK